MPTFCAKRFDCTDYNYYDCQADDKLLNCFKSKPQAPTRPQVSPSNSSDLLCHEGCRLVAVHDGCGESATWTLMVENQDGDVVAILDWPEVFGDWQTEGDLIKKGFECRVA
jgi:hypothetical protein